MLSPGISVGRYVVQRKLAEGGMAEIYLASAVGPEGFAKDVVLKVVRGFLASDQQFVQLFIAEARLASRLNHANVVQIFDFGKHDETYYLAMEYVRGASLWDLRKRCRGFGVPFPATLAAEIGAQVARGLHYAHCLSEGGQRLGVVHRDVTPHNILLSFEGAVKLTDFGIAKAASTQTVPGMIKGKFAYMSPEQGRGARVDARTDVFALGIVLWELLTGGRLFDGDSDVAVLRSVQESLIAPPARLNPDVAQDLSDIVMKALERNLDERFGSAFELEKALATWVLRNATEVEETSVSRFLQQMYREEVDQSLRPLPVAAAPMDDFGAGSTLFVDRSEQPSRSSGSSLPTMTSTPVPGAPGRAMLGGAPDDEPRPRRTEQMPGLPLSVRLPASTEPGRPEPRDTTEQQPPFKPAPVSRRFDPLPIPEPSLVQLQPREPEPITATPSSPSISHTEPADEAELPALARSKGPLLALAVALLGALAGVVLLALDSGGQPERVVVEPQQRAPPTPATASAPEPNTVPQVTTGLPAEPQLGVPVDAGVVTGPNVPLAARSQPDADADDAAPVVLQSLDAGEKPAPPPVQRYGTLSVKAVPFALVWANGRPLGEVTGSRTFKLAARTWEIEFVKNKVRRKVTAIVKPNEDTAVEFNAQ